MTEPIQERPSSLPPQSAPVAATWRTPALIVGFGCLIALMSFGPRSSLGFFLTPLSSANHWGRDVFAFALGAAESAVGHRPAARRHHRRPVRHGAGALRRRAHVRLRSRADGARRPARRCSIISAGVLIGFGLSGCSFMVLLAAFGKLLPPEWRSRAFGFGTAAGSFGQFLYSPVAVALMDKFGWQQTLTIFAVSHARSCCRCRSALATPTRRAAARSAAPQSLRQALARSVRAPLLRAAGARLLHLRLPARLHHRAHAVLSGRPRPVGAGRRLDARDHRAVQHRRLGHGRLARRPHAEALSALDHLFRPRRGDPRLHLVPGHAGHLPRVRRGHGPDVAVDGAADQRHHRA